MALYSIQVERHALGGLIQNPDVMAEVERFVSEKHFFAEAHNVIFSCLRAIYLNNEKPDKVLLAQKIKNLGISFKENINIFDYIDSISFTPITVEATIQACQELVKLKALRDIDATLVQMKDIVQKGVNEDLDKTVAKADAMYGKQMNAFESENVPEPLFQGVYSEVEERGNNPVDEIGLATPWPEFNRLYGGFRRKNLYIIAARAKAGKSTMVAETASIMSIMHNMPVLILDTEMSRSEVKYRSAAAKSNVGLWYLETGNWRKNEQFVKNVRDKVKGLEQKYAKVYHMYVGNRSLEEIASIVRRWHLKVVGRGNNCLVVYDYIKIIGNDEKVRREHQEMGDRVDFLKQFAGDEDLPVLTCCQNNREGVVGSRDPSEIIDDERSIGLSDRITHFASAVWIYRRRTPEEIVLDTPESGTHKLIEVAVRFQGRDAAGHQDFIRRTFPDGKVKYVKNFINFNVVNFAVEERGSLIHTIQRQNAQFLVADGQEVPMETL